MKWERSILYRRNRETGITVLAEVTKGLSAEQATKQIESMLKLVHLPNSVRWEFGGEEAESGSVNASLLAVAPLGILILDYIGQATAKGDSIKIAIQYSISKRIRPILLTTLTTIAGLILLAFTDATLWPPFAWTMISGMLVSTLLTLVVIPSATYLMFSESTQNKKKSKKWNFGFLGNKLTILVLVSIFLGITEVRAEAILLSWKETVKKAEESPRVKLAWEEWKRKHLEKEKFNRAVYYPKLGFSVEPIDRNKTIFPNASLPIVAGINPSYWTGGIEMQQVLFDPANWFEVSKALEYSEESQRLLSYRAKETSQSESLISFVTIH